MRFFSAFGTLFLTILLAACGGAGGPEGVLDVNGNRLPLTTTAAASVTVASQNSVTYTIKGGRPPYLATSDNTQIATTTVFSGNQLSISGKAVGTALITLIDVDGQKTTVAVTINPPTVAVPTAITIAVGSSASFVSSAILPSNVASSTNASVAGATIIGNTLTVIGLAAGSADIVVSDGAGGTTRVTVTVVAAP